MDFLADIADRYSSGELRVTFQQNLVLPFVAKRDLPALFTDLQTRNLARGNIGLASDIICCPGGDFCSLANAKSIPVAAAIEERLSALDEDIGKLAINISGCINACGHHHTGNIGVLGVEKNGQEWYQVLIGGRSDSTGRLGVITGRAVCQDEVPDAVERLVRHYLSVRRSPAETFVAAFERVGAESFKAALDVRENAA